MRMYVNRSAIALWFWLVLFSSAFAMTVRYDVKIQNHLPVPVQVKVTQYHSEGFNGTPPRRFTNDLKLGAKMIVLHPGELQTLNYSCASGGFWLQWKRRDPDKNRSLSGVLNLIDGENIIEIK